MTKATFRGKIRVDLEITVSEGESMIIMAGSMATGRHGTGAAANSLPLIHKQKAERGHPNDTLPQ